MSDCKLRVRKKKKKKKKKGEEEMKTFRCEVVRRPCLLNTWDVNTVVVIESSAAV